ncbi:hypothetical protein PoB_002723200 [Plakobranchus ocellatus]|uniref:Uncharacterized protein n=1 Tax=Plakobranchus ocellatus TaxID=259542 RepID=A0AAV4A0B0_9GAST|nr:hypothetical protein PoB_002723200 [Plakobranchus ocellatus]
MQDLKFGDDLFAKQLREFEELAGCFPFNFSPCPGSSTLKEHRPYPVSHTMRQKLCDELEEMRIWESSGTATRPMCSQSFGEEQRWL